MFVEETERSLDGTDSMGAAASSEAATVSSTPRCAIMNMMTDENKIKLLRMNDVIFILHYNVVFFDHFALMTYVFCKRDRYAR